MVLRGVDMQSRVEFIFSTFLQKDSFPIPKKRSVFCTADLSLILICKYSEG